MMGHSKCLGGGREFRLPPLFLNVTHACPSKPPTPARKGGMSNLNTLCYERSIGGA